MEGATMSAARPGWRDHETELLVNAAREAASEGRPLRGAFEQVARSLGRRPNSVRNHYYAHLRAGQEGQSARASFRAFTEDEVDALLKCVAKGRREGRSVRGCVLQMAGGDRTLMLRYQNKYRSLLKNAPARVEAALRGEDAPARACEPDAYDVNDALLRDPLALEFMDTLRRLMRRAQGTQGDAARADRDRVRIDLMRLRLTEQTEAAAALLDCVESYLNQPDVERARTIPALCERLPALCGALRAAMDGEQA